MQITFMIIPADIVTVYNAGVRPLIYIALATAVYALLGIDKRPIHKSYETTMVAILSIVALAGSLLLVSLLFGANNNIMTVNLPVIAHNLWDIGVAVVLGELIRYRLMKQSNMQERIPVIIMLTVVLAFGHMPGLRTFFNGHMPVQTVFFEVIFVQLMVSIAASYFAIKGNLLSTIMISFVYIMVPYLSPILPNITSLVFSLIIIGLLFITIIVHHILTNDKRREIKARENRAEKYAKKSIVYNIGTIILVSGVVAFFMGMFPIYPVVVLTGSMSGHIEQGSLVFVERVPSGEAFTRVEERDVIHFTSRAGVVYIHRVIGFDYDVYGQRQYITQGDANELVDPAVVVADNVHGIVRAALPFFGYPRIFFRNIFGGF